MTDLIELQKNFINKRFGTFIHFNSASVQFQTGPVIDWEYGCENDGTPRRFPFLPLDWNPDQLDCAQWAKIAKSAGCRFAALTAKHHEGFAMYHSICSAYNVVDATPWGRDILKELQLACERHGMRLGLYYSQAQDWHDPNGFVYRKSNKGYYACSGRGSKIRP